jgi:hypothetical protein
MTSIGTVCARRAQWTATYLGFRALYNVRVAHPGGEPERASIQSAASSRDSHQGSACSVIMWNAGPAVAARQQERHMASTQRRSVAIVGGRISADRRPAHRRDGGASFSIPTGHDHC